MAHFGHFGANFMHVVHKVKFVIFFAQNLKVHMFYLAKLGLNSGDKAVASCGAMRIKRTPSWRSQNERPVKTGARVVLLGHSRHYFVRNIVKKFSQTGGGNRATRAIICLWARPPLL